MTRPAPGWYQWEGDALLLDLRVQPRASRDEFLEPMGNQYRVRIKAPPVEGKANEYLLRFLASAFGVKRNRVALLSGRHSRSKRISILSPQRFPVRIESPAPQ